MVVEEAPILVFRRIDPAADRELVVANHRDACIATFGDESRYEGVERYLHRLREKVDEFPDGHVLALLEGKCIGQLELEVPYGLTSGYVNLYYVSRAFRRQGFGRLLHEFAERYFLAWEAERIELDVSKTNRTAQHFYRAMGYRIVRVEGERFWRMAKNLAVTTETPMRDAER